VTLPQVRLEPRPKVDLTPYADRTESSVIARKLGFPL
jgi:hypothetical protein